jgi:type IV pilus assembly protein PilA
MLAVPSSQVKSGKLRQTTTRESRMNYIDPSRQATPIRRFRRERGDILFGPMFFMGILAAIAIPAYQDYTIRSQVSEGLNLASAVKVAVAESYAQNGTWPANLKQLQFERTPRGLYVAYVTLKNGTILIRYGGRANTLLAGKELTLRPATSPQLDVIWSCGYADEVGVDPDKGGAAPHATTVPRKYLPGTCRGLSP